MPENKSDIGNEKEGVYVMERINEFTVKIDLLDFDRPAMKELVLMLLKGKKKEGKRKITVKKVLGRGGRKAARGVVLMAGKIDNSCWLVDNIGLINKLICYKIINKNLKKHIDIDEHRSMKAEQLVLEKEGNGMKVEIELKDVNLDEFLEKTIALLERKAKKKQNKKGKDGLNDTQTVLFHMLHAVNQGVSDKEKLKLLQMLLEWVNSNKLLPQVIDSLSGEEVDSIEWLEILKSLELRVGDVRLVGTGES